LTVNITFTPADIHEFDVVLDCIATEKIPVDIPSDKKIQEKKCSLDIKAEGSYPKLKIIDVRNDSISVSTLWESFSVNHINMELTNNLNEDEKKYNKLE